MKERARNIGVRLGMRAFYKGMPCIPHADVELNQKKAILALGEKNHIVDGWIDGWRSGELDANGGW